MFKLAKLLVWFVILLDSLPLLFWKVFSLISFKEIKSQCVCGPLLKMHKKSILLKIFPGFLQIYEQDLIKFLQKVLFFLRPFAIIFAHFFQKHLTLFRSGCPEVFSEKSVLKTFTIYNLQYIFIFNTFRILYIYNYDFYFLM